MPTRDKRFIWVDTYARWRIVDPLLFFQRLRDERGAQSRLDDILDGETRNAVARHDLIELVRSSNRNPEDVLIESEEEAAILEEIARGRREVTRQILETAAGRTADLGIELLDLRFKRINYVEEVQQDVFARMIAERQRIAEEFRSEGQGESARIHGERERELAQIQSEAYRRAEELRGEADANATSIYADAYNRDGDFYAFTKSLETYEATMDPSTLFILGTDSEAAPVPRTNALNRRRRDMRKEAGAVSRRRGGSRRPQFRQPPDAAATRGQTGVDRRAGHSARNTVAGSTRAARRAGPNAASIAARPRTTAAPASVSGSRGSVSNSRLASPPVAAALRTSPIRRPVPASRSACRSTRRTSEAGVAAQGRAYPDLPLAPADDVRHQAVEADQGKHHRDRREPRRQAGLQPRVPGRVRTQLGKGAGGRDGRARSERAQMLAEREQIGPGVRPPPQVHLRPARRILRVWNVDHGIRGRPDVAPGGVTRDSYDAPRFLLRGESQAAPDRVHPRPVAVRQRPVHDRDRRSRLLGRLEVAAGDQRDAERPEVARLTGRYRAVTTDTGPATGES